MKNKFIYFLIGSGIAMITLTFFSSFFSVGDHQIGPAKLFVIDIGVLLVLVGIGLFVSKQESAPADSPLSDRLRQISTLPNIMWVVAGFFIAYLIFIIYPIFLDSPQRMDFFNKYIPTTSPIGADLRATLADIQKWFTEQSTQTFYPPLVYILLGTLQVVGFPTNYIIVTLLTVVSSLVLFFVLPSLITKAKDRSVIFFVAAISIFSYGLQFELERGQFHTIALTLSFLAIYIFHKYPSHRFFAYLLFCVSVQLKVYPALLALMFVDDWRDWANNIKRFVALGIVNFLMLFLLGYKYFFEFITNIGSNSVVPIETWNGNHSIASFTTYLSFSGIGILSEASTQWVHGHILFIENLFFAYFALCLILVWGISYRRNVRGFDAILFFIIIIGVSIIPSISHDYTLPLVTAPFALIASESYAQDNLLKRFVAMLLLAAASFIYSITLIPFIFKPHYLQNSFPLLLLLLTAATLLRFFRKDETGVG